MAFGFISLQKFSFLVGTVFRGIIQRKKNVPNNSKSQGHWIILRAKALKRELQRNIDEWFIIAERVL